MTHPTVQRTTCARIPTTVGVFQLCHYANSQDDKEHLALIMGDVADGKEVLVRVHSECMTGDVFGSLRCDCGEQLHTAMQQIAAAGRGVIVYLRQEGRGIGLAAKLRAYNLQDEGYDTVEANLLLGHQADERTYWAAVGILADLQVQSVRLLTNNPVKVEHLRAQGVDVTERVPLEPTVHAENAAYLETKVRRMRHLLTLPAVNPPTVAAEALPAELVQRVDALRSEAQAWYAERGEPFVTLSYAQSVDGSIAARPGEALAISGRASLTLTHALRAAHDAILVGIGAVLADDPQLTVRLVAGPNPQPVVLDTHLRLPATARLLRNPRGVWVATAAGNDRTPPLGVSTLKLEPGLDGRLDLRALLAELGRRGVRSVMVEGGAQVIESFLRQGLAQAVVITVAPRFVGGLRPLAGGQPAVLPLPELANITYTQAGQDLIVWANVNAPAVESALQVGVETEARDARTGEAQPGDAHTGDMHNGRV